MRILVQMCLVIFTMQQMYFSMPDDQLYSLIAGGAISPVVNQAEVKNAKY